MLEDWQSMTSGRIGDRIFHSESALQTSLLEAVSPEFLSAWIDGFFCFGKAGNATLRLSRGHTCIQLPIYLQA
jgi:hypothetical protein